MQSPRKLKINIISCTVEKIIKFKMYGRPPSHGFSHLADLLIIPLYSTDYI